MRGADAVVLVAYFATMIAVGARYSRHMKSTEIYFAGGKQLPWWIGGVSFVMSYVSALSIVVYAGLGYEFGVVSLTLYWTTVPASILTTWLLARRWRRAGILTPTEFLERRFSPFVRQLFVWSGVPLKIIDESLKIVAIGIFVSAGLGLTAEKAMLAVGLTILVYAVLGGLWAVVVTDFVQFVLVTGAILLLLPLTFHAAGGWHQVSMRVPKQFFTPAHAPYGWTYVGAFLVLSTLSLAGNWSLIQKFYSARSDEEAVRVGWLATLIFLVLPPIWIATGMLARGYIPSMANPQAIYARLSSALLPAGMLGLIVAALFAATMSVLSSGYNVMSAVLTLDVYRRLLRPAADQRELVLVGRIITAGLALIVLVLALAVTHFRWTIFDTMVAAFGFFLPPTVLPMLAGLLSRSLSAAGALAGFIAGIGIGLAFLLYRWFAQPRNGAGFQALSIVIPAVLTVTVLVIAAVFFPARGAEADRANLFSKDLTVASGAAVESSISLGAIAGVVIAIMGAVLVLIGVVPVLTNHAINLESLIMGGVFATIGMVMIACSHLTRKQTRQGQLPVQSEVLHHRGT
ncbi:MAG: sodium transporter [Acidobacteria bacterium]|nr:MAG: sodium transporter [Acidobacteriota bacterium]PYY04638.1 MAG: sodium transporter [Acidobacteriota bacterium]